MADDGRVDAVPYETAGGEFLEDETRPTSRGFRHEYNEERPHERLQQQTPASQYVPSVRPYPERLPPLEYPRHYLVKKITTGGTFRFQHKLLYLANAMVDQHIGVEETDDGIWSIYFNNILLATLDERDYIITE